MRSAKDISVEKIASEMNVSPQTLRVLLQKGELPFGKAVKVSGQYFTYVFYPEKVREYLGE